MAHVTLPLPVAPIDQEPMNARRCRRSDALISTVIRNRLVRQCQRDSTSSCWRQKNMSRSSAAYASIFVRRLCQSSLSDGGRSERRHIDSQVNGESLDHTGSSHILIPCVTVSMIPARLGPPASQLTVEKVGPFLSSADAAASSPRS